MIQVSDNHINIPSYIFWQVCFPEVGLYSFIIWRINYDHDKTVVTDLCDNPPTVFHSK